MHGVPGRRPLSFPSEARAALGRAPYAAGFAAAGLLAALCGCASLPWLRDDRPWFENRTAEMLEIESRHSDGHRLKILLYPGTRVPLGAAAEAIEEIAVRRARAPEVRVAAQQIRDCLDAPAGTCMGWKVSAAGLEQLAAARDGS